MGERKIIRTTLGELIVAVTDEVTALMGDASPGRYVVVSQVVADLLSRQRARGPKRLARVLSESN
jgi:hypothetical protein